MTKRKHSVKKDIITSPTKTKKRIKKVNIKHMDIETIVTDTKDRSKKMTISRDISKDTTVSVGDKEVHHAVSRSTDIDLMGEKLMKESIPVMYGLTSIPPGPYNQTDIMKYLRYTLETATSADSQQIDKVMDIMEWLLVHYSPGLPLGREIHTTPTPSVHTEHITHK